MKKIIDSIIEDTEISIIKRLEKSAPNDLHIFYLSDDVPSLKYINNKIKKAKKFNVKAYLHQPKDADELQDIILNLPHSDKIIIQYPIDNKFGDIKFFYQEFISKEQDVDGFLFDFLDIHSCNTMEDFLNHNSFSPTAKGALQIIKKLNVKIEGCNVTVLGKGLTSGLPIGNSIAKLGANLTWLDKNSSIKDFTKTIKNSDIIISCTGAKNIINQHIHSEKENAVYINVGMSADDKGNIIGDINYDEISSLSNTLYVNDVLKSTGFLTTLNLISNCI